MNSMTRRVLVVDDDPSVASTFRILLAQTGVIAVTAASGAEALRLMAANNDLALVITDLRMPGISGLELLAAVRELHPNVPVILFSSYAEHWSREAAQRLGAADFVTKDSREVINAISQSLNSVPVVGRISTERLQSASVGPADRRWLTIVLEVANADTDTPTVQRWAERLRLAVATIKRWCTMTGLQAAVSLDFARAFRVVVTNGGRPCDWYNALDIAEPRTLAHFLEKAGFRHEQDVPNLKTFLETQKFVRNDVLLESIAWVCSS